MFDSSYAFLTATSADNLGTVVNMPVLTMDLPWSKMPKKEKSKETVRSGASGTRFTGLFLEQAPMTLHSTLNIRNVQETENPAWTEVTCDFSAFLTPAGMSYPEVRHNLLSLFETLRELALKFDTSEEIVRGIHLQVCNEVIRGVRGYSLNLRGITDLIESQKLIETKIRENPVLDAVFLLAAKRLRSIGRWSWCTITEEDLFGPVQGPASSWKLKQYMAKNRN